MTRSNPRPDRKAQSRFKGVTRTANGKKWQADLYLSAGKPLRLGSFATEEEAALAYDIAALRHIGPASFLNCRDTQANVPIVVGDFAMVSYRRDTERGYFLIDAEDAPKAANYYWRRHGSNLQGKLAGKDTALSILLMGEIPPDHVVAHVNGNALDNRKCNLAVIPIALNAGRQRKQKRWTKSMYKGVRKANGRWSAYLAGKSLGTYDTEEQAARAYDNAAREHFGIYAAVNFPKANEIGCLGKRAVLPVAA